MRCTGLVIVAIILLLIASFNVFSGDALNPSNTKPHTLNNSGPLKLKVAATLGGPAKDEMVGAKIMADGSICLAGNGSDFALPGAPSLQIGPPAVKGSKKPAKGDKERSATMFGFVLRLSSSGNEVVGSARFGAGVTVHRIRVDSKDQIVLLAETSGPLPLGTTVVASGRFLLMLNREMNRILDVLPVADAADFGVDSNGDLVVLAGKKLVRFGADRKEKWSVTWKTHGDNRPGGMDVCPTTGVACVIGYGMTHTGKEPYKDPYAYGFDRNGKEIWMLWNPDPKKEKATQFSTPELKCNGLMADTTGKAVSAGPDGKFQLMLFADGGNSVCTRDPQDVDKPLDRKIHDGVYQKGPGHGFKGASKTSVVFRVDAASGTLEKGTWICAWLSKQRANGLAINDSAADGDHLYVAGDSAGGCPVDKPWIAGDGSDLPRGGFLAMFSSAYGMLQCGNFTTAHVDRVAARNGTVVIAGSIKADPSATSAIPAPAFKPTAGGGESDAFFAIFKSEK